ncbi:MAG TPA: serine protease [Vicinamibacterales bacterium]|nr:serine protease [Vicinamibacterales bacterium]
MYRHLLSIAAAMSLLCTAAASTPAEAQDNRAAAREVVQRWQSAVVNVRVVLKMRMSMAGREMQSSDDPVDAVGTVIDPSGLTVLSLGALNPGALMSKIMGSGGGTNGEPSVEITSEPTDVKIRLADGQELPARIVLRDEDLDLAFLRPTRKLEKPLVAIDLKDAASPVLLDQVLVLTRLGRVGGWTAGASLHDVSAIISKPRTFYVLGGSVSGMGTPAFTTSGRVVGLLTLRQIDAGRPGMASMMGGAEGLGMLGVILPAADVLEIARQATDKP